MDEYSDKLDQGTGVEEAAAAFEGILAGSQPKPPRKTEDTRQDVADILEGDDETIEDDDEDDIEDDEADETAEDDDDDTEDDDDDTDEDDADADAEDDEEGEEPDPDTLVTIKVNGKDEKVPLKEAIAGYQRQADYTRKTQEVAEARRQLAEEGNQIRLERAQYSQLLDALRQQIKAEVEPDWEQLRNSDPLEYAIQRDEWRERQDKLKAIDAEKQRLSQAQQQEQMKALAQHVEQEREKLVEAIPELKDPKKGPRVSKQLREYGETLGFTPEDLDQAYDHRAILALYKAMKFDQLTRKGKPRPVPVERKGPRPMKAGAAPTASKRVTEAKRAKDRLAKTGDVRDAAAFFEKLL